MPEFIDVHAIYTMCQFLLADAVFVYSAPRRKHFILRILLSVLISIALAAVIPNFFRIFETDNYALIQLKSFFMFMLFYFVTVIAVYISFDISFFSVISLCTAGYAIQHIAIKLRTLHNAILTECGFVLKMEYLHSVWIFFAVTLAISYFVFGKKAAKYKYYNNKNNSVGLVSIIMIIVIIGLNRFADMSTFLGKIGTSLYAIVGCVFTLIVQFYLNIAYTLDKEKSIIQEVLNTQKKQYERTKSNIDAINIKCHDLKHKLLALRGKELDKEIEEIEKNIDIYDSNIKTGNDALDVILSEKNILAKASDILITYLGDGALLNVMNITDLYALFGNALDNAIEAVKNVPEKDKKGISVAVENKGDYVIINVFNYYSGNIDVVNGQIETTKDNKDSHGFGLKSIDLIARKYGGSSFIDAKNGIFLLSINIKTH